MAWWDYTISVEHDTDDDMDAFFEALTDFVCDFYGGHGEGDECPRTITGSAWRRAKSEIIEEEE